MKMPRISVYVPCYNGGRTLEAVLASLTRQSRAADELIVIDDNSTDDSVAVATSSGVTVLKQTGVNGLARARNMALEVTTGDILAGIDSDVVIAEDYLRVLEELFETRDDVVGVCGRLDEHFQDNIADRWRAVHMAQHHGDQPMLNPRFLFGATMAVRREPVMAAGGWNDKLVSNYEDVELCQRLRGHGDLFYEPALRASHLRTDTPISVLNGFWKWREPARERQGQFADLDGWKQSRLESVVWGIYRFQSSLDTQKNQKDLTALTELLPWSMLINDLFKMGVEQSPAMVAQCCGIAFDRIGVPGSVVEWFCDRLKQWKIAPRIIQTSNRPRTLVSLLDEIVASAVRTLPGNPSYWAKVGRYLPLLLAEW